MALEELRQRISGALKRMSKATILVENVLHECLDEISRALLLSDFKVKLVSDMQTNIKKIINVEDFLASHKKFEIIEQAIRNELSKMLDPGKPPFTPKKGETCVVMFVGLQGSEKTTACVKYAYHHLKKGWNPALVCADVFTDGAFDRLKQKATKAKIPFFGSYMELDPVKIVKEGVERFKKQNCDLIIVDTDGQHKQEAILFEEMRKVYEETKPDLVLLAMDSSIGQAAFDQAQAFKQSVAIGAVIVTKMDGHAKGGGALSAVAATKSPITFIDTGKHMDEFQVFDVKPFVSHLLGTSDCSRSMSKIQEGVNMDQQVQFLQKLSERSFTMRIMYEICQNLLNISNLQQAIPMLRGFSQELMPKGHEEESIAKIKCYMTMMDSLTKKELDSPNLKLKNDSRIEQIASGCGCEVREVTEMLLVYKRLAKIWNNMKWRMFPKQGHKKASIQQLGGRSGLRNSMMQLSDYCESQLRAGYLKVQIGSISISDK